MKRHTHPQGGTLAQSSLQPVSGLQQVPEEDRLLDSLPGLMSLARVASGARCAVYEHVRFYDLYTLRGFTSMNDFARDALGMKKGLIHKTARAGAAAWTFYPEICTALIDALRDDVPPTSVAFPTLPSATELYSLACVVDRLDSQTLSDVCLKVLAGELEADDVEALGRDTSLWAEVDDHQESGPDAGRKSSRAVSRAVRRRGVRDRIGKTRDVDAAMESLALAEESLKALEGAISDGVRLELAGRMDALLDVACRLLGHVDAVPEPAAPGHVPMPGLAPGQRFDRVAFALRQSSATWVGERVGPRPAPTRTSVGEQAMEAIGGPARKA